MDVAVNDHQANTWMDRSLWTVLRRLGRRLYSEDSLVDRFEDPR